MKKILTSIWISLACLGVTLLTISLIIVFYIVVAFRKLFIKDFTPNALRDVEDKEGAVIMSAQAHLNKVQASLEKGKAGASNAPSRFHCP